MSFLSGLPIVGNILNNLTGQSGIDQANKVAKSNIALQKQWLAIIQQIFDQGQAAIADARANGVFDPMKIREVVQRNVSNITAGVAARGLIEGAKPGDTTQSENIAQSAIQGGRALENVDFEALQREMGAISSLLPASGQMGAAFQGLGNANLQGLGLMQNAQSQANQQLGTLAGLGFQFLNSDNAKPEFTGWGMSGSRPGSFGR